MSDLTDAHFQRNIRANPGDSLARLIYADWLEERGDSRSTLIRLFEEALQGYPEALEATELLPDSYSDLFESLSLDVQMDCLLEIVASFPITQESPHCQTLLTAVQAYHKGEISKHVVNQALRQARVDRQTMAWGPEWETGFTIGQLGVSMSDHASISIKSLWDAVYGVCPDSHLDSLYLILVSYYLFGVNVVPHV